MSVIDREKGALGVEHDARKWDGTSPSQMSTTRLVWKVWTMPGNIRMEEANILRNSVEDLSGIIFRRMKNMSD